MKQNCEKELKNEFEIPYGYGIKISKILGLSQNTITKVAQGKNKNPITRMKIKSLLDKMLKDDIENSRWQ